MSTPTTTPLSSAVEVPSLASESPVAAVASKPVEFATPTATAQSLRDKIFAADDIVTEAVEVPEWGVTVQVRTMTGAARANMLASATDSETGEMDYAVLYPQVIVASCIDPDTNLPVFTTSDVDRLNQKSAAALERVAQAGMRVSGMTGDAEKTLGNDSSAPNGGSTSN